MTETTLEHGGYPRGHSAASLTAGGPRPLPEHAKTGTFLAPPPEDKLQPGECYGWRKKKAEIGTIEGDKNVCQKTWQDIDALGNAFIRQLLLSF